MRLLSTKDVRLPFETIVKRYKMDEHTNSTPLSVAVCSLSPISNWAIVCEDGWVEQRYKSRTYEYFENEKELFALHCKHNAWLASIGWFDFDPATINFFNPSNIYFDKSGVMKIADIQDKHIDMYFTLLRQSYKSIGEGRQGQIRAALETQDQKRIQEVFSQ